MHLELRFGSDTNELIGATLECQFGSVAMRPVVVLGVVVLFGLVVVVRY